MNIPPLFQAIRAVSAEFASRMYLPVTITIAVSLAILLSVSIWLVTVSGWWWFLLAPVIIVSIAFLVVAAIAGVLLKVLRPVQTKAQRKEVKHFVDVLQKTSEAIQTPKFVLLFRLIKDVVFPSKNGFIEEISSNAASLKSGFQTVVGSFK